MREIAPQDDDEEMPEIVAHGYLLLIDSSDIGY
jgi:hypothetical protein